MQTVGNRDLCDQDVLTNLLLFSKQHVSGLYFCHFVVGKIPWLADQLCLPDFPPGTLADLHKDLATFGKVNSIIL